MHLREATANDHPSIGELLITAFHSVMSRLPDEDAATFESSIPAAINRYAQSGTWLIAEQEGDAIGTVAYFRPHSTRHPLFQESAAHIQLLGVIPGSTRSGAGSALLRECESRAREHGAAELLLQTSHHMVEARLLYERVGFTVRQELQPVWGAPTYLYCKQL